MSAAVTAASKLGEVREEFMPTAALAYGRWRVNRTWWKHKCMTRICTANRRSASSDEARPRAIRYSSSLSSSGSEECHCDRVRSCSRIDSYETARRETASSTIWPNMKLNLKMARFGVKKSSDWSSAGSQ